jgi:antitoxin component of MazEF toxin-antitoxin module
MPMNPVQKPIRIGNSKGARIPAQLIRAYHLERGFIMKPIQEGILIAPADGSKLTLEESFAAMAVDQSDLKNAREWAASGLSDGLEEDSGF